MQKVVTEGPQVITTDYLDGFQYRNAVLQFFPHAEGYVVNTQTVAPSGVKIDNYNYVYNYLDHLGNVRLSYAWDYNLNVLKIIEENGYYPYGLRHSGYNGNLEAHKAVANETKVELKTIPGGGGGTVEVAQNMVRFNHREWQSELDLNVTDMDFRQYNNDIGRFVCTDPITHYTQSPYQFGNGNPIYWADPSGMDGIVYGMSGQSAWSNPYPRGHQSYGNTSFVTTDYFGNNDGSNSGGSDGIFWGTDRALAEQSWEGHLAMKSSVETGTLISIFINHSLGQSIDESASFKSTLKIFSANEDIAAMKYLIDNSDDGYGRFVEMASLITESSTFVFNDPRNTESNSYTDLSLVKAMRFGLKTYANEERILAQVHTHNEHSELSSADFNTSKYFSVPVYALDINSSKIGRGFDFKNTSATIKYQNRSDIGHSIYSLLNGTFNIRQDAKNILIQVGLY